MVPSATPNGGEEAAVSSGNAPAISVRGLTKSYGEIEAVRGIDFEVARGEASPRRARRAASFAGASG